MLRNDGHVEVNQLRIVGTVGDTTQGYFTAASVGGRSCSVSSGGGTFVCEIGNPSLSSTVTVSSYVFDGASEFSMQLSASSRTVGTTEMLPDDNQLTRVYTSFSEAIVTVPATGTESGPAPGIPPVNTFAAQGGGGGSTGLFTLFGLMAASLRRLPIFYPGR